MKLLKTITNKDFDFDEQNPPSIRLERIAVRAVILNESNQVAIIPVTKGGYHKLPGGGVEDGEDMLHALKREVLEEVGVDIEVIREIGIVQEHRDNLNQKSYCYLARARGIASKPMPTVEEIGHGLAPPIWILPRDAISLMELSNPSQILIKFILLRDLIFLKEAEKLY